MISVIIPTYNAGSTMKECLDGIFSNKFESFEVIIVSDKSTDNSIEIAKNYNCKIIELEKNKGPSFARNTGANSALGDILLFLDSDCVIKNDALIKIDQTFKDKKADVIQGVYSHEPNYENLATQYQQSFYCYYTWQKKLNYTESLTSMCFAVSKKIFIECKGFDISIKTATAEDEDFGHALVDHGYKIFIFRELTVEHRVNYSLVKFIIRSFIMYVDTMKYFIRSKTYMRKVNQKNYSNVLMRMPVLGLIILTLLISFFFPSSLIYYIFFILNVIFLSLHLGLINFIRRTKGLSKACKIIPICYLDSFMMSFGSICGSIAYLLGKKY